MNCRWCDEEIESGQECGCLDFHHHECASRVVAGSVGHQLRLCSCYGGDIEDLPGVSKREAARMAMNACVALQRNPGRRESLRVGYQAMVELAKLKALAPSIECPKCGMVSYNPTDVQLGYCAACHDFHNTTKLREELRKAGIKIDLL